MKSRGPVRTIVQIAGLALSAAVMLRAAAAAELVMFERQGCAFCMAFDRDIGPIYPKTDEGKRVPLRRVDADSPLPPDLAFLAPERITPTFVLVDRGHEIGRFRGYTSEEQFWGLFGQLVARLDPPAADRTR
jgi:hypothetical protein